MTRYFKRFEMARLMGVSMAEIGSMIESGELESVKTDDKGKKYEARSFYQWVLQNAADNRILSKPDIEDLTVPERKHYAKYRRVEAKIKKQLRYMSSIEEIEEHLEALESFFLVYEDMFDEVFEDSPLPLREVGHWGIDEEYRKRWNKADELTLEELGLNEEEG